MSQLNLVMEAVSQMHQVFYSKEDKKTDVAIQNTINELSKAKSLSTVAKQHRRQHLVKILDASVAHLERVKSAQGWKRKKRLKTAFEQLAHIVRTYKVDKKYKIFFCSKDKATWVQKGWGKKHPFEPSKKCGRVVF